jgi:fucose permease
MVSMGIMVCSGALICFAPGFGTLLLAFFVLYLGNGMIEITLGIMAAVMFTKNTGTMLNLAHFFYGVGAAVGPIVSAGLMATKVGGLALGWRYMYLVVLAWAVVPLIPAAIGRYKGDSEPKRRTNYREALKNPLQWGVILMLTFGATTEMGIGGWLANYMEKANGMTPEKAALTLTAFFVVFTFARLIVGPFTDRFGYTFSVMLFSVFGGVLLLVGVALGARGTIPVVASAVFISPLYPTVMAAIAKIFAKTIDTAMTVTMTVMGIVSMVANLAIGGIVDGARIAFTASHGAETGLGMAYSAGMYFLGALMFASAFAAAWLLRRLRREGIEA